MFHSSVQPAVAPTSTPSSMLRKSFGLGLAVCAALLLTVAFSNFDVNAAAYFVTGSGPMNWTDTNRWAGGPAGSYPGQVAGDSANLPAGSTLNIDVSPAFPVVVTTTFGVTPAITINPGQTWTLQSSSNIGTGGSLTIPAGATLVTSAGTETIRTAVNLSGTWQNDGTVAYDADILTMSGGSITSASSGTINVGSASGITFSGANGPMTVSKQILNANGSNFTLSSTSNALSLNDGTQVNISNTRSLILQNDAPINTNGVSSNAINIQAGGGMSKSGTTTNIFAAVNNNGGTISAGAATIAMLGGGTQAGNISVPATNSRVKLGGPHAINAGTAFGITDSGVLELAGGTTTLNVPISVPSFEQTGGILTGGNSLTSNLAAKWTGGTITGGTNVSYVNGGTISGSGLVLSNGSLTNGGTVSFNPTTAVAIDNGGSISNGAGAIWNVQSTAGFSSNLTSSPAFNNSGALNIATGGTVTFGAPFTQSVSGSTNISGTTTTKFTGGGTINGGTIQVAAASDVFAVGTNPLTFTLAPTFSGTGLVYVGSLGTITNNVTMSVPNFQLDATGTLNGGGTLNVGTASTWSGGTLAGGTLGGAANINITSGTWTGGTLGTGGGAATSTGTLNINGAGPATLARNLTSTGTINYAPASALAINATLTNNGLFDWQNNTGITGAGALANGAGGTFKRSGAGSPASFSPGFTNAGTVQLLSGTTNFNTFTQSGGTLQLNGGNAGSASTMAINGGSLSGFGTVTGNVAMGAANLIVGGAAPGTLIINGNYTQAAGTTVNIQLNGPAAGTQYDQLKVTGAATISGGTLSAAYGFTPTNGQTFDVMQMTSHTGDFTTYSLPTFGPGSTMQHAYVVVPPDTLRLSAVVVLADVSATQSAPTSLVHTQNGTWTITVANAGPDPATNVVLTDNFTGGTFVSAAPSQGTCAGTGPVTCTLGTIASGGTATVTLTLNGNTVGNITNSASVTATETDPNAGNNSAAATTTPVTAASDLSIAVSGPTGTVNSGSAVAYVIAVTNNGPDAASGATVTDTLPSGTTMSSFSGTGWNCTGTTTVTCTSTTAVPNGGSFPTLTINSTAPATTPATNSVSVTPAGSTDLASGNNGSTTSYAVTGPNADLGVTKSGPATASNGGIINYLITVTNAGPAAAPNVVITDPTPAGLKFLSNSGGCTTAFPCTIASLAAGQSVVITARYSVTASSGTITNTASVTSTAPDAVTTNNSASAQTDVSTTQCSLSPATGLQPTNGLAQSPVTFSWNAVPNATSYKVFASVGGASTAELGSTTDTSFTTSLTDGTVAWYVEAYADQCASSRSATITFNVCNTPEAPLPSVVALVTGGHTYTVEWKSVTGAGSYELQEATNAAFTNAQTFSLSELSKSFTKTANNAQTFFYRVRALAACDNRPGRYSETVRTVVLPAPSATDLNHSVNVPVGEKKLVSLPVFVPGQPGISAPFIATADQPWIQVTPASGILPPDGITLTVSFDPANLPNGTFTGTIIVTFTTPTSSSVASNGTTAVSVPVSVNLVTPVAPARTNTLSANTLVIPSVGHLDGQNSAWRSDVRVANTSFSKTSYALTFVPAGADFTQAKQTQVSIDAGSTIALDDIVKSWYGIGATGDAANGVLTIRPLDAGGTAAELQSDEVSTSLTTVASSRTYNAAANGTLGQFIPAIPFGNFIGKPAANALPTILSMQQIAQNADYRTNLGLVEASGQPVTASVSVFNGAGTKLTTLPFELKSNEQRQLNSFLQQNGITLNDGRIEVAAIGGNGKLTAYASVVDNRTNDPLLVSGASLSQPLSNRYVIPGVADITNSLASWRSDIRLFNASSTPQSTTLTFVPTADGGAPTSKSVVVNPGEVKSYDNILQSLFAVSNVGGALQVVTSAPTTMVVSGRTFNKTADGGTFGQFIPAVTPNDAVGKSDRSLSVLQVEDSARYRTNLGLAEVTGKAATVEVSVFLPQSKVTPKVQIPLAANEFKQVRILQSMGLENSYNARVAVKVIDGDGKITAYGSVIDMQTQDPTYVPAQ